MKVRIGALDYTVRAYTGEDDNDEGHLGECCYAEQEILIDGTMPADRQASVLLHELGHAIIEAHGLEAEAMTEEGLCDFLGGPFAAMLRGNPAVGGALSMAWGGGRPIVEAPVED